MGLLSVEEFDVLGEESGYGDLEISKHGYLLPAYSEDDMKFLQKSVDVQRSLGIPTSMLTPEEVKEVAPYLDVSEIIGGAHCKGDGVINPMKMALAFKKGAQDRGVEFNNYTTVTDIRVQNGKVAGVVTDRGEIATNCVVNAAGMNAKKIGRMAGVTIPVEPEKHQIIITEPLEYMGGAFVYSSLKYETYIGQVVHGGFLMGWSDPNVETGIVDFEPEWRVLEELCRRVVKQVPALKNVRVVRHWAGQYDVCPDRSVILGPVREVDGFLCASGCTKVTMFAPAIGILLSEIVAGVDTTLPMEPYLIDRFPKGELVMDPALL